MFDFVFFKFVRKGFIGLVAVGCFAFSVSTMARVGDLPYGELSPFETDGCTHFPNGNDRDPNLWLECCVNHDLKYWIGGSEEDRLSADEGLKECVIGKGEFETANLMYEGVRIAGSPYFNTSWRWGFGWAEMRGYSPLTPMEKSKVKTMYPRH